MPKPVRVEPGYFANTRGRKPKSYDFLDCLFDREQAWQFKHGTDFTCSAKTLHGKIKKWAVDNDCFVGVRIEKGGKTVVAQAFELTERQRRQRQRIQDGMKKRDAARRFRELHDQSPDD